MTQFNRPIKEALKNYPGGTEKVTEGFCLQVHHKGKKVIDVIQGHSYPFYDLASLTKVIFTNTQVMHLVSKGKLNLNQRVKSILPWFAFEHTTIRQLLNHTAGYKAWHPFYKDLIKLKSEKDKKIKIIEILSQQKKRKNKKAVYSDLDYLTLGFLLEETTGQSLLEQWQSINKILKTDMHFNKIGKTKYAKQKYSRTEKCPWRKKILQGEVHDDNAWSMGGIAPHAGLFGTADDVSRWGLFIRKALVENKNSKLFKHDRAKEFLTRSVKKKYGDWAIGFMMPTKGQSSCGDVFSLQSVGHTGFTGTSFWLDPKKDLMVVLLSNRVYPSRENIYIRKFRPWIHNKICEVINV